MESLQNRQHSLLMLAVFCLIAISLLTIFVATREHSGYPFVKKQLMWVTVGSFFLLMVQRRNYRQLGKHAHWLYGFGLIFLVSVFVVGKKINGAVSWIDLGFFRMQPSEITRISTLLLLARLFESGKGECKRFRDLVTFVAVLAIPTFLVLLQPDLGMALIYLSLGGCFLLLTRFASELKKFVLVLSAGALIMAFTASTVLPGNADRFLRPHQLERLTSFLHPEVDPLGSGYQYLQARSVVGSGQLGGTGMLWVITANGKKLPEQHTDFIFAVIAQQWGFIGASVLLLLYFVLFYILVQWAMSTPDLFASFFMSGMVTMWFFQVFVNVGMNIGLSPITGLTLPFISYGGSSFISNMIALGLVLSMKQPPPLWELE
ncbi:MAG: FtsW/RodA/SpoVE family cell cycle protein [Clostridia bacterium]